MIYRGLGLAMACSLLGCGDPARATFDQMHAAACAGDADKFFVHVSEERVLDNTIKSLTGTEMAIETKALGADGIRMIARESLNAWRADINSKGKDGDICAWNPAGGSEKIGDERRMEIRTLAGNKKLLYFALQDGEQKLVKFSSAETADAGKP